MERNVRNIRRRRASHLQTLFRMFDRYDLQASHAAVWLCRSQITGLGSRRNLKHTYRPPSSVFKPSSRPRTNEQENVAIHVTSTSASCSRALVANNPSGNDPSGVRLDHKTSELSIYLVKEQRRTQPVFAFCTTLPRHLIL